MVGANDPALRPDHRQPDPPLALRQHQPQRQQHERVDHRRLVAAPRRRTRFHPGFGPRRGSVAPTFLLTCRPSPEKVRVLMATRMGLLGKKMGMTQIFDEEGQRIPVTVIELGPNVVIQKKTKDSKDGYNAIQLGFDEKPVRKLNKPMTGHYKRHDLKPMWILRELRIEDADIGKYEVGQQLKADVFQENEYIDVAGVSKGKGMQGVMKLHNMKG